MGSDRTQRMGRRPSARATERKGLIQSAKTRRERVDIANGIYKRDIARKVDGTPEHRHRAIERPTAKADKDSTKKERGMERASDSDRAPN